MNNLRHAYIGISEKGTLALFVAEYPLSVCGPRLLTGNDFPPAVRAFYSGEAVTESGCIDAIRGLEGFLRGEGPQVSATPEFGKKYDKKGNQL